MGGCTVGSVSRAVSSSLLVDDHCPVPGRWPRCWSSASKLLAGDHHLPVGHFAILLLLLLLFFFFATFFFSSSSFYFLSTFFLLFCVCERTLTMCPLMLFLERRVRIPCPQCCVSYALIMGIFLIAFLLVVISSA